MVVLAGFLANSLTFGVLRSLGALSEGLVGAFKATTAQVSWVTGITLATKQFASKLSPRGQRRVGPASLRRFRFSHPEPHFSVLAFAAELIQGGFATFPAGFRPAKSVREASFA